MVALAMAFAAFWGVFQLAVLGWGTRTVRVGTLVLVLGAGFYGSGAVAAAVELAWTRLVAAVTGGSVADAVRTAGYTVDPFVEEAAKILPLVVAGLHLRTRRQWGLTDHVLVAAAAGAGFGLLEAVMRFGHQPAAADPLVPGPAGVLASWLPAPVDADPIGAGGLWFAGAETNLHLAWSALAGLGVGLWFRGAGRVRWAGPALVVLAGAAHAAHNYDVTVTGGGTLGDVLSAPFTVAGQVLWLWPAVAVGTAVFLDVGSLRRARAVAPPLRLRREGTGSGAYTGLARYAALRPPWTAFLVLRFVAMRRAALYACADGVTPEAEPMLGQAGDVRSRLDVADHPAAWRATGLRRVALDAEGPADVLRRFWPLLVWALLLVPPLLYYGFGTTPATDGVQEWLERPMAFGAVFVVPAGFGLVLLAWHAVTAVHALPAVLRQASGELPALLQLRVGTALGASLVGVLAISAWLTGTNPARPLMAAFHVVDSLDSLLLTAGLALMLGAFVFLPPAVTLVLETDGRGPGALVPVVTLTGTVPTPLGLPGVVLAQAVASSGGAVPPVQAGAVPDLPRQPAPPKPPVHHGRLRRIVDDLWSGTGDPARVGDGTTMDAVRNEVLTGRPTHGRFHLDKARHAVDRLTSWLDEFGSAASRTDRSWAWELRTRLQRSLEGR